MITIFGLMQMGQEQHFLIGIEVNQTTRGSFVLTSTGAPGALIQRNGTTILATAGMLPTLAVLKGQFVSRTIPFSLISENKVLLF